jgi:ornithine cyclodeaminase/alanine dehydrogenase-like protein (mu-crystallin family)
VDVHAELAEVVAGTKTGWSRAEARYVFDSTGLAAQDHAAVTMIVERAQRAGGLPSVRFDDAGVVA